MGDACYLPLVVSLVLWFAGPYLARVLPPATAVRLLTLTAVVTAVSTGFVLAVAGLVVMAQVVPVAAAGHWSAATIRQGDSLPAAVGGLAGVAVVLLVCATGHRLTRVMRDLWVAGALRRSLPAAVGGLVVWDDELPDAFALPGLRGRVVVSTAMLRALPAEERRVLLAHEAAHLRCHHHIYRQCAALAAAANPLLRTTAVAVADATERWADETAASVVGDRLLTARALARASLARTRTVRYGDHGDLLPASALAMVRADVPLRVRALLAPPPPRRVTLTLGVLALVLVSLGAAAQTANGTEAGFDRAQQTFNGTR